MTTIHPKPQKVVYEENVLNLTGFNNFQLMSEYLLLFLHTCMLMQDVFRSLDLEVCAHAAVCGARYGPRKCARGYKCTFACAGTRGDATATFEHACVAV